MVAPGYIRFFASLDDTDLGRTAAAYCDALAATGFPVRLVATRSFDGTVPRTVSLWQRHLGLLTTPMEGPVFVNAVCDAVSSWMRLWTAGCMNVLLIADPNVGPRNSQLDIMDAISRYDFIYAPSNELANVVERVSGLRPVVVPLGTPEAADHMRGVFKAAK